MLREASSISLFYSRRRALRSRDDGLSARRSLGQLPPVGIGRADRWPPRCGRSLRTV